MNIYEDKDNENSKKIEYVDDFEDDYFDQAWKNRESRRRCEVTHRKHKMSDFEKLKIKKKN